jgi:hypothetical protein
MINQHINNWYLAHTLLPFHQKLGVSVSGKLSDSVNYVILNYFKKLFIYNPNGSTSERTARTAKIKLIAYSKHGSSMRTS